MNFAIILFGSIILLLLVVILGVFMALGRRRRKQLEHALELSQERWKLALEASQEGVWDWDLENRTVYYSPRWEEIFGYKQGEAPPVPQTFTALVHPDEFTEVVEDMRRLARKEITNYKKEIRMYNRDGTPMWTLRSASVIFNKDGEPVRVIGTTKDITERKKAEAALLKSENQLKLQIERMPIGFIVWTIDFRVLSWNPSAEAIFGFTEEEMLGKHPYGYMVPAGTESIVDKVWQRLVEGDISANSINDNRTKDGRVITCIWTNTPIRNDEGQVTSVISMVEDITGRKKAEEKEARRNAEIMKYQQVLVDLSSLPQKMEFDEKMKQIIRKTAETISCERVSVWRMSEESTSITTDYIYKMSTAEYLPGTVRFQKDCPEYFNCLKKGSQIVANNAHTNPATSEFSASYLTPLGIASMLDIPLHESTTIVGVLCLEHKVFRNWTKSEQAFALSISNIISLVLESEKRRKAEEKLTRSQINFEEAQEIAHVGNWDFDLTTGNLEWSKEMYRLYDVENQPKETLYEAFRSKIHPEDLAKLDKYMQRAVEEGEPYLIEKRIACSDGSPRYLSCIGEPVKDAEGKVIALRGTSQNVTLQKQAALAKSEFLSIMSHEIRTPINGVVGIVNLLMEENLTDLQREYVETLDFSAQHLTMIVSDILDFSKIESGNLTFEEVVFDVEEMCNQVFKLFKNKAQEKNIEYCFTNQGPLNYRVSGDILRLNQILANLLSNAVKFTEKGIVEFGFTVKEETPDYAWLRFYVKDSGIGILESEQDSIFEYFHQGDESISRKYGGTGLGLSISKKLVELLGGEISVESNPGKGSLFSVELKFKKNICPLNLHSKKSDTTDFSEDVLSGMKVLVAEDHHINALVLVQLLTKWKVECVLVSNGKEAVDRAGAEKFDLVLMDIWMPGMDGIQALKRIRSSEQAATRKIPVIAFTADASLDSIRGFRENGFDDCITKPFNPKNLFNLLKKYYKASTEPALGDELGESQEERGALLENHANEAHA